MDGSDLSPAELAAVLRYADDSHLRRRLAGYGLEQLLERALVKQVSVAAPAAGSDWAATVPPGCTWDLLAVRANLAASAVVANRQAVVVLAAGALEIARCPFAVVLTAGSTWRTCWLREYGDHLSTGTTSQAGNLGQLPPLAATSTVSVATNSLDAGDQWASIVLTVREWSPGQVAAVVDYLISDLDAAGGIN